MENGVFKCVGLVQQCVGLVQQYASANSKLHGMRDLVSPADALSLGAETLFFVGPPGHSHIVKVSSLLSTELLL